MGSSNSKYAPDRKRSTRSKKKRQVDMEEIRAVVARKLDDSESEIDWGTERVRNLMARLTLEQKVWQCARQ